MKKYNITYSLQKPFLLLKERCRRLLLYLFTVKVYDQCNLEDGIGMAQN